jgi:regulator of cell morphogenesis and NO signaling
MVYIGRGSPVAKLADEVPGAMEVLESFGVDYACAGELSLEDAAYAEGIEPEVIIAKLRKLKAVENLTTWGDRSLRDLIRHLGAQHHHFVRDVLARLSFRLADLDAEEMRPMRVAVARIAELLLPHLHREEADVFPAIAALEDEHLVIAVRLREVRDLRLKLEWNDDLPLRCREVLESVATLEANLHEYLFLENAILFPRALAMDEQVAVAVAMGS